jgi:hypothetical protein
LGNASGIRAHLTWGDRSRRIHERNSYGIARRRVVSSIDQRFVSMFPMEQAEALEALLDLEEPTYFIEQIAAKRASRPLTSRSYVIKHITVLMLSICLCGDGVRPRIGQHPVRTWSPISKAIRENQARASGHFPSCRPLVRSANAISKGTQPSSRCRPDPASDLHRSPTSAQRSPSDSPPSIFGSRRAPRYCDCTGRGGRRRQPRP